MGPIEVQKPGIPRNCIIVIQYLHISIGEIGGCKSTGHIVALVNIHGQIIGQGQFFLG